MSLNQIRHQKEKREDETKRERGIGITFSFDRFKKVDDQNDQHQSREERGEAKREERGRCEGIYENQEDPRLSDKERRANEMRSFEKKASPLSSSPPPSLIECLQDEEWQRLILTFAEKLHCEENLLFWWEVEEYRLLEKEEQRAPKAKDIYTVSLLLSLLLAIH
jgi:hypothetical protein